VPGEVGHGVRSQGPMGCNARPRSNPSATVSAELGRRPRGEAATGQRIFFPQLGKGWGVPLHNAGCMWPWIRAIDPKDWNLGGGEHR